MKKVKTEKNINTEHQWDFTDLYKDLNDPKLEQDIAEVETLCADFEKKYKNDQEYLKDESNDTLVVAMNDWEKLHDTIGMIKPLWYLFNMQSIMSGNAKLDQKIGQLEPRATNAVNRIVFFPLELGKLPEKRQAKILKDPRFAFFVYYLKRTFEVAKYNLTEEAEKVNNLLTRPARTLWIDGFEKLTNKETVKFKGKNIPLSQAQTMIHQLPLADRRKLHDLCMEKLKSISYFAEQEINAVYTTKKINDELRGYEKPYSETIIGYENSIETIENLVKTVSDNFAISNRFYTLKKKLLKLPYLEYADRAVGIAKKQVQIPFEKSVEILRSAFGKAGERYLHILDKMLKDKRIDVYSRIGKRGGAYCWGGQTVPTVVLLNYVPSVDAVMTFAHEMGHAIHTELSKKQRKFYQSYTISVAEIASTFFENLAFQELFEKMSDTEKIYALYDRLADSMQTIFRQIACFNFELKLHEDLRKNGALTAAEICKAHNTEMSRYLGKAVKMHELDGYLFCSWSHIRNFFYVYSYAYGELISRALYKKCKEDDSFFAKVDMFLEAGNSMSPDNIFKSIGFDVSKSSFFEKGLQSIEEDLTTLEKLMKKNKMI